jgi:hypothetical protein
MTSHGITGQERVKGKRKEMHRRNEAGLLTRAVCAEREVGEVPVVYLLRMLAETEALHHQSRVSQRDVRLQETL